MYVLSADHQLSEDELCEWGRAGYLRQQKV